MWPEFAKDESTCDGDAANFSRLLRLFCQFGTAIPNDELRDAATAFSKTKGLKVVNVSGDDEINRLWNEVA